MSKLNLREEGFEFKIDDGFVHRDGTEYVVDVYDADGEEAGYFKFNHWDKHPVHGEIIHVMEANVVDKHRRKGIATAVYDLMEEKLGLKIHQEPDQQSELAKKFWRSR